MSIKRRSPGNLGKSDSIIFGEWYVEDDGIARPVIRREISTSSGFWVPAPFLVGTSADRTVFSAAILANLHLQQLTTRDRLGGVRGVVNTVGVEPQIRLYRKMGRSVVFRGQHVAVTEVEALDISVLGCDIPGLFAVIVDRPGNVVCLLRQRHRYAIEQH